MSIELKASKSGYCKKNGALSQSAHIQEQAKCLRTIRSKNHYADFAGGFGEARTLVDWYMSLKLTTGNPNLPRSHSYPYSIFS